MLTSPVNVITAAASGAGLKSNTATSDNNARREPPYVPVLPGQLAETSIEPELPSNSPIGHVNAAAATVANRTVLQELTINVATMLRIPRRPDENLTALFLRIIATIENMPQADRLAFEMRAGLKPLRITLSDLLLALRNPDGQQAARLTAIAEAPAAVPGRTAANAATTTYLEDGTDTGHTEETLAMRAAARNSAAGQSVFSAENKVRVEAPPTDGKVLQNQLKSLFEPGETRRVATPEKAAVAQAMERSSVEEAAPSEARPAQQAPPAPPAERRENVVISSASLKLDQPTLDKIRNAAQAIASQTPDAGRTEMERPAADKAEAAQPRLQTLLTLKGLAEAVGTIPARAAEMLAGAVAEAAAPLPDLAEKGETGQTGEAPDPVMRAVSTTAFDEAALPEFAAAPDDFVGEGEAQLVSTAEDFTEPSAGTGLAFAEPVEEQAQAALPEEHPAAVADRQPVPRHDLAQHGVPFAYAQVQPARDEHVLTVSEEDEQQEADDGHEDDRDEQGERRRPRDEYDAIHDELAEEEPVMVITRDSSESDRAFALYQRMGGF